MAGTGGNGPVKKVRKTAVKKQNIAKTKKPSKSKNSSHNKKRRNS